MENDSAGGDGQDPPIARALETAGHLIGGRIGVIEACRALSSLRHSFGAEYEECFRPFVGIDSETDELPIGPVRREWSPEALARKDIEIGCCERTYRNSALEACWDLVERLQSRNAPPSKDAASSEEIRAAILLRLSAYN
jgi:hypothetical protein